MVPGTDACKDQLGYALLQKQPKGRLQPIGVWSRSLASSERSYSTSERECIPIVWEVLLLRPYRECAHFTLRRDQATLRWTISLTDASGRLERWRLRLMEYEFDIVHRHVIKYQAADALCRISADGEHTTPL